MTVHGFVQGRRYAVGFDLPWYAPESKVKEKVESLGFRVLGWWSCERAQLPVPIPAGCGDTYDHVGVLDRVGPDAELDLPSQVAWVLELGPSGRPPAPRAPEEPGGDPSEMGVGDLHRWARRVLLLAWPLVMAAPTPTRAAVQIVQAVAAREGLYGWARELGALRGHNNWGNITCACAEVGAGPCVRHGDRCYRSYALAVDGARALLAQLCRSRGVVPGLEAGRGDVVVRAMKAARYFEADLGVYEEGMWAVMSSIAAANGEQVEAVRGAFRNGGAVFLTCGILAAAGGALVYADRHGRR